MRGNSISNIYCFLALIAKSFSSSYLIRSTQMTSKASGNCTVALILLAVLVSNVLETWKFFILFFTVLSFE